MLNYYLGKPDNLKCLGDIYPIKIENYEEFQECCKLLYISKNNFTECDVPLLDLVFACSKSIQLSEHQMITQFEKLFTLTFRKPVHFGCSQSNYGFLISDDCFVGKHNYDCVRKIIMQQNLMFEPKIYKNKVVQEWAESVIKAKSKNSIQISIEDMCSTVANYKGLHPWDMGIYSIYQLYTDYYRIRYLKGYDTSVAAKCAGSEKTIIEDFAKEINLLKNPYDDLFVSKDKLNKLNEVMEGK
jgi:putative component of toxin-antitoxin plasmid stabilization module